VRECDCGFQHLHCGFQHLCGVLLPGVLLQAAPFVDPRSFRRRARLNSVAHSAQ
jgi:hypothetical protein